MKTKSADVSCLEVPYNIFYHRSIQPFRHQATHKYHISYKLLLFQCIHTSFTSKLTIIISCCLRKYNRHIKFRSYSCYNSFFPFIRSLPYKSVLHHNCPPFSGPLLPFLSPKALSSNSSAMICGCLFFRSFMHTVWTK